MKQNLKQPVGPEAREVLQAAAALGTMTEQSPVWQALMRWFERHKEEAEVNAVDHQLAEDKRAGYCGRIAALRDLREELEDLRSGAWKGWGVMKGVVEEEDVESGGDES